MPPGRRKKPAAPRRPKKNPAAVLLGRKGGSVTSRAKAAAARANGAKGGRPRTKRTRATPRTPAASPTTRPTPSFNKAELLRIVEQVVARATALLAERKARRRP